MSLPTITSYYDFRFQLLQPMNIALSYGTTRYDKCRFQLQQNIQQMSLPVTTESYNEYRFQLQHNNATNIAVNCAKDIEQISLSAII